MRHNIGNSASGLIRRKCKSEFRIEHREARTKSVAGNRPLELLLAERDDAVARSLAARRGNREDRPDRQRRGDRRHHLRVLAEGMVREVAVIRRAESNRLRRVDDASAADGEDEVDLLLPAERNALPHERLARIGLHAPELDERDARIPKRRDDLVVDAGALDAPAAEMDEHLRAAELPHQHTDLRLGPAAEHELRRRTEFKVNHFPTPFLILCPSARLRRTSWRDSTSSLSFHRADFQAIRFRSLGNRVEVADITDGAGLQDALPEYPIPATHAIHPADGHEPSVLRLEV